MKTTLIACISKRTIWQADSLRSALLTALLLAPLADLHAADRNGASTGNVTNPGTKAERSPLPAKKQGSRPSQSPSRTQDYGDFSLNKI